MRKPIPWEYTDNASVKIWEWFTKDFKVTILSEGSGRKSFGWKIIDCSQGRDIPFESSISNSFNEAVDTILELIGKSYTPSLGYGAYAGELATTFTVASGMKLDFAPLVGETVIVKVIDDNLVERILTGSLQISNYLIKIIVDSTSAVSVPPERIKDIQKEYGGISLIQGRLKNSPKATSTKLKRVFNTEYVRGCTGRPGFKPGTVEHGPGDPYCPIHNV